MDELKKHVSYSELASWMECNRKHYHSYIERLHKQSYSMSSRMNIGILVHEALEESLKLYHLMKYEVTLEQIYAHIDLLVITYDKLNRPEFPESFDGEGFSSDSQKEIDLWEQDLQTAVQIAKRTIKHLDVPKNWRVEEIVWEGVVTPLVEFRFEYPILEDRSLVGKIDLVARSVEDGLIYLFDWKTRGVFSDDWEVSGEDMSLQLSLYQYVLNSLGVDVSATITYQIRSKVPQKPVTIKSGKMSRANITTDWPTYEAALLENNENPEEYQDMKIKFGGDEYWFLPIEVVRGRIELQNRWETAKQIATKMVNDELHTKYESPRCCYCPYFKLCLGEDRGLDVESIKQIYYTLESRF